VPENEWMFGDARPLAMRGNCALVRWVITLAVFLGTAFAADLVYKPAPIENPLKGIITFGRTQFFPHSLEHIEIPFAQLMPDSGAFDWPLLEKRLQKVEQAGHHAIIRVILDWPGRDNSIPLFLQSETYLARNRNRAGEPIPNYDSPQIAAALKSFIAAFGQKFDGHRAIGFIEAGLLGLWGETLPTSSGSPELQQEILTAYTNAFHTTKILARYPSPASLDLPIGYHDDWFGHKNETNHPLFAILATTRPALWQTQPIGGRLHPEIQRCISHLSKSCELEEAYLIAARDRHFTFLRIEDQTALRQAPVQEQTLRQARKLAQLLGYEFYVSQATVSADARSLSVKITIKNTGVAPFFYSWPVQIALAKNGAIQEEWAADWDIRKILPDNAASEFSFSKSNLSLPPGDYMVLARIRNSIPEARAVAFANEAQDSVLAGWLTLGSVSIRNE
jgi:hypothetical protein